MRFLKWAALAALLVAGAVLWVLWEDDGPSGPSISERATQSAAPAGPVSSAVIPVDDLPPEGTRSLFDHLVADHGVLPYPFDDLIAMLAARHPDGTPPVSLMIPDGRSLLKAQADFHRPRVLVAADFQQDNAAQLGLAPRGRLFLGFVEDASEIEVISWNEAAGRFEFQLVQDYRADGVPRIVYARRAVCTTCHQGGGPIFPQRPWNETNGQAAVGERIAQARGSDTYLGLPARNTLAAPERFDELTDVGNFLPVAQRLWLDGCGDGEAGTACRRAMLRAALAWLWNPGGFDEASAEADALRAAQAVTWPANGIPVPESDLRNRDPLSEADTLRARLRAFLAPEPEHEGARSNEDLDAFESLPKLPAAQDPLTPRPPRRILGAGDLDGAYALAGFFTVADAKALEAAAGFDRARLLAAVDALPAEFLAPAPFGRVRTLQALLPALGAPAPGYAFLDTSALSPPQAIGVPPLELAEGSVLEPFRDYCFACHRGNPAARLDFMSGETEAEVLALIEGTPSIRDVLDWDRYLGTDKAATLMPPADSPQRAALEAALAEGRPVLEEMRTVVPGLFDF